MVVKGVEKAKKDMGALEYLRPHDYKRWRLMMKRKIQYIRKAFGEVEKDG